MLIKSKARRVQSHLSAPRLSAAIIAASIFATGSALAGPNDPPAEQVENATAPGERTERECGSDGFIIVNFINTSTDETVSSIPTSTTCIPGDMSFDNPVGQSSDDLIQNYSAIVDRASLAFVDGLRGGFDSANGPDPIFDLINSPDSSKCNASEDVRELESVIESLEQALATANQNSSSSDIIEDIESDLAAVERQLADHRADCPFEADGTVAQESAIPAFLDHDCFFDQFYKRDDFQGINDDRSGADFHTYQGTFAIGANKRIGQNTAVGAEIFYSFGTAKSEPLQADVKADYVGGTVKAAHQFSDNVRGLATVGYARGFNQLVIKGSSDPNSDFSVNAFSASAEVQGSFDVGQGQVRPTVKGEYFYVDRNDFSVPFSQTGTSDTGTSSPPTSTSPSAFKGDAALIELPIEDSQFSAGSVDAGADFTYSAGEMGPFQSIKPRLGVFATYQGSNRDTATLTNGAAFEDLGVGVRVEAGLDFTLNNNLTISVGGDFGHFEEQVQTYSGFIRFSMPIG